jgi:hypothetical protein
MENRFFELVKALESHEQVETNHLHYPVTAPIEADSVQQTLSVQNETTRNRAGIVMIWCGESHRVVA